MSSTKFGKNMTLKRVESNGALDKEQLKKLILDFFEEQDLEDALADQHFDPVFAIIDKNNSGFIEKSEMLDYLRETNQSY